MLELHPPLPIGLALQVTSYSVDQSSFALLQLQDGSGKISPLELQSAMALLNFVGPSAFTLRQAIAAVPGNAPAQHELSFEDFCRGDVLHSLGLVSNTSAADALPCFFGSFRILHQRHGQRISDATAHRL